MTFRITGGAGPQGKPRPSSCDGYAVKIEAVFFFTMEPHGQSPCSQKKDGDVGANATSSHLTEMNSALTVELPNDR